MKRAEKGFGLGYLLLALVMVVVFAVIATLVVSRHTKKSNSSASSSTSNTVQTKTSTDLNSQPTNPYVGWKTYTSSTEKLTFKYPPDWLATPSNNSTQVEGADSLSLKSPTGTVSIQWFSSVEGIGGACNQYLMPGATPEPGDLGPCGRYYVLHKQRLTGADLYYVDGVIEQSDGKAYQTWCGIQSSSGIVQDTSSMSYLLFKAKNTFAGTNNANHGPYQAELACGSGFGGIVGQVTTKDQATAFLSNPEMLQAKDILLSASY